MLNFKSDKEKYWKKLEEYFPGIRDKFEKCAVSFILFSDQNPFVKINFGHNNKKESLIKCHIYKNKFDKIFSFYFNINTKESFVRNEISTTGRLKTSSNKILISSLEELDNFLIKLINEN